MRMMANEFIPIATFVVATVVVLFRLTEQTRQRRLAAWARRSGWRCHRGKRTGLTDDYPGITLFASGHSRYANHVVSGQFRGRTVTCMDYHYSSGAGRRRANHRYAVTLLETGHPLVPLKIRREHVLDRLGDCLGTSDIMVESAEFNRRFHVSADDDDWAREVLHAGTTEFLLASPSGFLIEFGHHEIVVFRIGHCGPRHYRQAVKLAWGLGDLLPESAISRLGDQPPQFPTILLE